MQEKERLGDYERQLIHELGSFFPILLPAHLLDSYSTSRSARNLPNKHILLLSHLKQELHEP